MENKTNVVYFNPKEWLINRIVQLNNVKKEDFNIFWINFDKNIEPEYKIIRQSSHDGTLIFTQDLIAEAIEPLLRMTTCYLPTKPKDESKIKEIHYTVGELELKTEYGMVNMKAGRYPGETNTVTIPVRCEYIMA